MPQLREMELHEGITVTSRYESLTGEPYETLWTVNPLLMPGNLYAAESDAKEGSSQEASASFKPATEFRKHALSAAG